MEKEEIEEILKCNKKILDSTIAYVSENGYRVDAIKEASLDYIKLAKGLGLSIAEFQASLNRAGRLVSQSVSASAVPDITAEEANV